MSTELSVALYTSGNRRRALWSDEAMGEVEALMLQLSSGERLDRLGSILWEHLSSGGKQLRARLTLAAAEVLGHPRQNAVPWAVACEMLHNATLVHDDLQDGDRLRRGREAVWVRHGVAQAINVGDLALMLPYRALEHLDTSDAQRWYLSRALARAAEEVVRGQSFEMTLLPTERLDWDDYARATTGKTAALFGLPVEGAALLAGYSPEQARDLAEPFRAIGLLFQIQDDVLDLYGDKGRGIPGSDLAEGKVSALVVEHLRLHPQDASWLLDILRTPRDETRVEDIRRCIDRFAHGGALDAVWRRIDALESKVEDHPAFRDEDRLRAVASELVARALVPVVHTRMRIARAL